MKLKKDSDPKYIAKAKIAPALTNPLILDEPESAGESMASA